MNFNLDVLKIDPVQELNKLSEFIVGQVNTRRKRGVIVGLSGGIDSACIAAVAVHALGKEKVIGLILPEKESNPISSEYAIKHAQALGIEHRQLDITPTVDSVVKYSWRDEYLQKLILNINLDTNTI
jgi:NAD+ synthase